MPRTTITVQRKLTILRDADERQLNNKESLKSIARSHGIQAVQIRNWRKQRDVLSLTRPKARSLHKGKPSTIKYLEDAVIGHAIEMRQIGVGITYNHLVIKACQLDEGFRAKTYEVQYQLIRRLCNSNCPVNRRRTHVCVAGASTGGDRTGRGMAVGNKTNLECPECVEGVHYQHGPDTPAVQSGF
ncbi:transposase [Nitzschia inconspicua]|uniref:Transposase n=1 Tax=Nitzschia inconspicua TaxID=303405 RepID=A0A9K3KCX4_9STRA|nr:transposase [Nitzschia inconspicua]KAG7367831.1 transposase [Nitzschia inconspicua]